MKFIYQHKETLEKKVVDLKVVSKDDMEALKDSGFKRLMRKSKYDFIERETRAALKASPESYRTKEQIDKLAEIIQEKWNQRQVNMFASLINAIGDSVDSDEVEQ